MIKNEVPNESNPRIIVPKVESLVSKSTKYNVKLEKSKLTYAHQDYYLEEVKKTVSAKIISSFYQNYVKAEQIKWRDDPVGVYQEY